MSIECAFLFPIISGNRASHSVGFARHAAHSPSNDLPILQNMEGRLQ